MGLVASYGRHVLACGTAGAGIDEFRGGVRQSECHRRNLEKIIMHDESHC